MTKPLTQAMLTTIAGTTSTNLAARLSPRTVINVENDFGSLVSGSDWTAALNAASAYILANSQVGTIVLPSRTMNTTDTWLVGDTAGTGPGTGTAVSINIEGTTNSQINYLGPTNRAAIWVAKNKRFTIRNLFVTQATSSPDPGTSIGMILGGSVNGTAATDCTGGILSMCGFANFQIGLCDGAYAAASEMIFEEIWFTTTWGAGNTGGGHTTYGALFSFFNSTNHTYINCQFQGMDVGLATGGSSMINVLGGGNTSNGIDYLCEGRCRILIDGVRNEGIPINGRMIKGDGGQVVARNLRVNSVAASGDHAAIAGTFRQFALYDSAIEGYVIFGDMSNTQSVTMIGNLVWPDPTTLMPFSSSSVAGASTCHVLCKGNTYPTDVYDATPTASRIAVWDFEGRLAYRDVDGYSFLDATIVTQKQGTADSLAAGNVDLDGIDYINIARCRSLSEGSLPGLASFTPVPFGEFAGALGQNLRIQGTFSGASATLAITFKRTVSVTAAGVGITLGAGTWFKSDVGKRVLITGGGNPSGDFHGTILYLASTTNAGLIGSQGTHNPNYVGAKNAVIGQDEPDGNYMVLVTGNANETFAVSAITSTGFTVTSSNATSTATVTCLIIR